MQARSFETILSLVALWLRTATNMQPWSSGPPSQLSFNRAILHASRLIATRQLEQYPRHPARRGYCVLRLDGFVLIGLLPTNFRRFSRALIQLAQPG